MASGSLGNPTTVFSSYTPAFTYTNTTNLPTVQNISVRYALYDDRLLFLSVRFNLTDKGSYESNSSLNISLPSGLKNAITATAPVGVYYDNTGVTNMVVRINSGETNIRILYGIDGYYSAPHLETGYQGFFAVIPVKR